MNATQSLSENREPLVAKKTWVIKIGSSLLTDDGLGLNLDSMARWVKQMVDLRAMGKQIVIVSSGAVAEGMARMGWEKRPVEVHNLQAAAAIGQMGLVQAWERAFAEYGIHTAQILMTHEDMASRKRYLNAKATMETLLELGVIPIVNENDTVSTDEIRLGDNDTLASLVLGLVGADVLAILTDQQGLYDANPRENPFAKLIHQAPVTDQTLEQMASPKGGLLGSGGMRTKVLAAKKAASFGGHTLIASGREEQVLIRLAQGEELGTWLVCNVPPMAGRKQWLNSHVQVVGRLKLDAGAVKALLAHKSLLPVGVLDSIGQYERGDMVACIDEAGTEIARGVINYSSRETHKIKGVSSERIEALLGYVDEFELIHKDNLILKVDLPQV